MQDNADQLPLEPIGGQRKGLNRWVIGIGLVIGCLLIGYGWFALQWRWALADLQSNKPREARSRLLWCERIWPRSSEVQRMLARAARMSREPGEAEKRLQAAQKLAGGATERLQLEYLLLRATTGDTDEPAVALGTYLANDDPESVAILETLAAAYIRDLRYGPAYSTLERWIGMDPENATPLFWRGWVLERLNQAKSAMGDYRKALELDPELFNARLRVAEMLLEDKQPEEALPHLEQLMAKVPNSPQVMARLGQCRYLEGKPDEARQLLEKAQASLPDDGPLMLHLAKLDVEGGKAESAIELLNRLLKRDRGDTEARFLLVSALRLAGKRVEAEKELAEYELQNKMLKEANNLLQVEARTPSTDADSVARIGKMLLELGQEPQALYWLDKALERDPRCQMAHQCLYVHFTQKGDTARAATHQKQIIADGKKN